MPREDYLEPSKPAFFTEEEYKVYEQIAAEYYTLMYPRIPVLRIDHDKSPVESPLQESPNKVYKKPIYVPGHVQWSPDVDYLSRFGIETEQDVLIVFPDVLLREQGVEDLERDLVGAIVVTPAVISRNRYYVIRTVHKRPPDVISPFGHSYNVYLDLDLHRTSIKHHQFEGEVPDPDDPALQPLFYSDEEMRLVEEMLEEGYRVVFQTIPFQVLDTEASQLSYPVVESEHPVFKDPVYVPGYVKWNPTLFDLRSFGIEHDQEVLIVFPTRMLADATETEDVRDLVGSLVTLDLDREGKRKHYQVLDVNFQPSDAISTRGHVPQVALSVNLYRQSLKSEPHHDPVVEAEEEEPFVEDYEDPYRDVLGI